MEITDPCPMAAELAARIRNARDELTAQWLERIAAHVSLESARIFPADTLLDHVPILMDRIADFIERPQDDLADDAPVVAKARELGELRFSQGFDATEILKEYEILGGLLFAFCSNVIEESAAVCEPQELFVCAHRLFRAISMIEQVTTANYLRKMGERVGEREERLRRFNRMLTHELKNRVGATLGAGQLLQEEWLDDEARRRFAGMVEDNAVAIQKVLENLVVLSQLDRERRRQRHVRLRDVVAEVFDQLRALARARDVELRMTEPFPDVQVNAAALELCIANFVSNSIKYSDPKSATRWTEVEAVIEEADSSVESDATWRLVIRVRDNGLGVPPDRRDRLFERFYRAHDDVVGIEGTGLGLSLVRETAESLGGTAWAEFDDGPGAVFAIAVPCQRDDDAEFSCVGHRANGRAARRNRPAAERATASDSRP